MEVSGNNVYRVVDYAVTTLTKYRYEENEAKRETLWCEAMGALVSLGLLTSDSDTLLFDSAAEKRTMRQKK